ncbi:TonB-dependent receptor plug domain-containing protein [Janthinobacterium fluminis]|uniref:TonB-dependent receptor n=1 Tax=Janthinobacterium fluminis TaxID=2987524 RepID=A0ABT5K0A6_9BURK|nr:TonB-dependent receptor [Janthinobacterium fluminis]MDC8758407.1 TonB-dependent receptor [Janthinobacterium fluminis]
MAAEAPQQAEMQQVVVTATLRNLTAAAAPAFTTVVTAEDIAKSPVNSLADLLRETVGVNNQSDGTGRDEIQIRGLSGKYTLMLVNGKRMSSAGALWRGGDFDFSSIPLSSIKRVEIVRGPMAALYGSDAIGGVVNIITHAPTAQWKGTLSSEYRTVASGDEGQQYRLGATTSGAINDRLSLSLTGEVYDRQPWYLRSAADTTRPVSLEAKKTKNLMVAASLKLSETQTVDLDVAYNNDQRPRGLYYYSYNAARKSESRDYRETENTRTTFGVTHKALWDWGSSTANVSHEKSDIEDFNTRYKAPQRNRLSEENTYAKMYANFTLGGNTLAAGVDLREQTIKDAVNYRKTGKMNSRNSAIFVEDEIALSKELALTLAGRMDKNNNFGSHFSPKAYLVYQLNNAVTLKGGVSQAFKAPDAYQLSIENSTISCGGACQLAGNPNLKPETSTNYEAGIEFHQKGWNLTAVGFDNKVKDMIVAVYNPVGPSKNWTNVASAKTRGIELQAEVDLSADVSVSGNVTRLKADYIDETGRETKLENRPSSMGHVSLNWKFYPRMQASLSASYTGSQYYQAQELPGYTRYDLALSSRQIDNVVLRFGVKNLSNVVLEDKHKGFLGAELGRNYYVSAAYSF